MTEQFRLDPSKVTQVGITPNVAFQSKGAASYTSETEAAVSKILKSLIVLRKRRLEADMGGATSRLVLCLLPQCSAILDIGYPN